jgi:hypothetical protein
MAGTRGGVGRIVAMAIALAVVLVLVLVDAARAGTYEVAQCGWGIDAEVVLSNPTASPGEGITYDHCLDAGPADATGLSLRARPIEPSGAVLSARWVAAPGTAIVAARAIWSGEVPPGFRQELGIGGGDAFVSLASATGVTVPGPVVPGLPGPAESFEFRLSCPPSPACATTKPSWASLREATITVADGQPPLARAAGPLLAAGWHRGKVALELAGDDVGAGVGHLQVDVAGTAIATAEQACAVATIEGARRATAMRPCPPTATATVEVDTSRLPDGRDPLRACAADFAGNVGCAPEVPIEVDNSPPAISLARAYAGRVVATVLDPLSGPASGSIEIRPPGAPRWTELSTAFRPAGAAAATLTAKLPKSREGAYLLRARAVDAVGNAATALSAAGGDAATRGNAAANGGGGRRGPAGRRPTDLVARLGGRSGGRSRHHGSGAPQGTALTVPFGTATELRGRLTTAHGESVADRRVKVVIDAARGARQSTTVRRVATDRQGRFELLIPPGPSRRLVVSFAGGGGFAPSAAAPLALSVGAAVSLAASPRELRTGETVVLRGRVGQGAGRIPARGKLVAIQYLERASGEWRPALVDRTDSDGRFDIRYRFRYITGTARIRLRATALPEAGWPYAAGSSSPVTVEVRGG